MDEVRRRWAGSMPEVYEQMLAPTVFRPFALDLARRVGVRSPQRVIEVAAGTGVLTRELVVAVPAAEVTATDLNPAMVQFGRQRVPGARWRESDASDLPFGDGEFDLMACQFGVMFFPDKREAFAEARRVLRGDGTLLFTVWGSLDSHDFEAAVVAGLRRAFPDDPPDFLSVVPHGYSDLDIVVADLAEAGLRCVALHSVTLEGSAASATDVATGYCMGTPLRPQIEARGDLDTASRVVAQEIERRLGTGIVAGSMTAHVIEAVPAT